MPSCTASYTYLLTCQMHCWRPMHFIAWCRLLLDQFRPLFVRHMSATNRSTAKTARELGPWLLRGAYKKSQLGYSGDPIPYDHPSPKLVVPSRA